MHLPPSLTSHLLVPLLWQGDPRRTGTTSRAMFGQSLKKLCPGITHSELSMLFSFLDPKRTGVVSYTRMLKFLMAGVPPKKGSPGGKHPYHSPLRHKTYKGKKKKKKERLPRYMQPIRDQGGHSRWASDGEGELSAIDMLDDDGVPGLRKKKKKKVRRRKKKKSELEPEAIVRGVRKSPQKLNKSQGERLNRMHVHFRKTLRKHTVLMEP